ncbi:MAG: methylenetetrahydrofolate reductase [NAD(P)H] [Prevotellaceae bacterium]|jgi:methylenetetrahydrofolate reductase (NADPH)|nr:methylenetetrahydrofolate reductase [NAD(P)H] [Prevotellaceae bacterium]
MKISNLFQTHPQTFSFEFFPPKDEISAVDFGINVGQLIKLNPSFVSVTYGAGGSSQERTFALVDYLQNKIGLQTMAHYTCVNASKEKIQADMQTIRAMGIENLMALRGDPPKGLATFDPHPDGFTYANELVAFIRAAGFDFCFAAAAYPETHPEAPSREDDIRNLKKKIDAGASFLLTQLFYDNTSYFHFVAKCRTAGIACRIIPGILPITTRSQWERFAATGNAPAALGEQLKSCAGNPRKIYQTGMDFAIAQCRELLSKGAPGLHFFTLNKSRATIEIFEEVSRPKKS